MADLATLMVKLGADLSEFSDGMNKADSKLAGFASAAVKAGAAVGAALVGVGVAATKMSADFESDMKNVETLLGAGMGDRMNELSEDVKRMAQDTGKPLKDLAGGLYQVISAFGDTADSSTILEISAKSSAAGLATTQDAVNLLSAVTKGYGDTSAEAVQRVSDLAFQTVKLGQTTFPELAASMGKAVPLAATLGVQVEELFGSMATLTGVTGNTAEVSTQLRATMQALINPSTEMGNAFTKLVGPLIESGKVSGEAADHFLLIQENIARVTEELGQTTDKAQIKKLKSNLKELEDGLGKVAAGMAPAIVESLGFQGTLNAVAESAGGNNKVLAKMFGSVEALNAVLALTGPQADVFTEKTAAMSEAAGASAEAFEIQQESVNAMLGRLRQTFNVMMVNLGEQFLPKLLELAQWVMTYMPQIQAFFDEAFKAIGAVVNWVSENVLPLFQGAFSNSTETAAKAMEFFHDRVVPALQKVWKNIQTFVEAVQLIWAEWGDEIMAIVSTTFNTIWTVIENVLTVIGGLLDAFIGLFTGDWARMKQGLLDIWTGLWGAIEAVVTGAWDILKIAFGGLWESFKSWFSKLASDAIQWGRDMMQGFLDGITGMFSRIWSSVSDFASGIGDKVKSVLGISSPSRVFAEIGANIGKGLALGIEGTHVEVSRAVDLILPGTGQRGSDSGSVMPAVQPAGAWAGSSPSVVHNYHIAAGAVTIRAEDLVTARNVEEILFKLIEPLGQMVRAQ